MLPLAGHVALRAVRDLGAVGRIAGLKAVRDRQLLGHAAGQRHGEQLHVPIAEDLAIGVEQHLAIGREATHEVGAGVPGQAGRRTASDGDRVGIDVAVVLGAEGDGLAIGRKARQGLDAQIAGQAADVFAVEVADPEIFGIDKGHVILADGRLHEQPGVVAVGLGLQARQRKRGEQHGEEFPAHRCILGSLGERRVRLV